MMKRRLLFILLAALIVHLCPNTTFAAKHDYGVETKTIQLQENFINYYLIHKQDNDGKDDSLIIYLNGSDLACALGPNNAYLEQFVNIIVKLNENTSSEFAMLIPDKINMGIGQSNARRDEKVMSHYTLQERVFGAVKVIDECLSANNYKSVLLVGASEGGGILPKVYNSLKYKEKVSKIVILAGGGLSQYEEFKYLQKSDLPMPAAYRGELQKIDTIMDKIKASPDSMDNTYLGWPYKRWSGFLSYRPLNELVKIDIPILVMHGGKDINTPVESSRMIQEEFNNLGKTNLVYIEYKNLNHYFGKKLDTILNEIANWLINSPVEVKF